MLVRRAAPFQRRRQHTTREMMVYKPAICITIIHNPDSVYAIQDEEHDGKFVPFVRTRSYADLYYCGYFPAKYRLPAPQRK